MATKEDIQRAPTIKVSKFNIIPIYLSALRPSYLIALPNMELRKNINIKFHNINSYLFSFCLHISWSVLEGTEALAKSQGTSALTGSLHRM